MVALTGQQGGRWRKRSDHDLRGGESGGCRSVWETEERGRCMHGAETADNTLPGNAAARLERRRRISPGREPRAAAD